MRKLFITLSALGLLAFGSAFAQVGDADLAVDIPNDTWVGASVGFPGLNVHVGRQDVLGAADLRGTAAVTYGGAFGIGADILADLPFDFDSPFLEIYAGGGAFVTLGGGFGFGVQGLIGGEYFLAEADLPEGAVFLELGPAITVAPSFDPGIVGRLGFNYYF